MGKQKYNFFNEDNPPYEILFEALLENISESVFFKDKNLRIIKTNHKSSELLGLKNPEEAIGKTDKDFFPKEIAEKTKKQEKEIIETGKSLMNEPMKIKYPDGTIRWVEISRIPFYNNKGEIAGIAGIAKDISDWMDLENKLHQKNVELKDKNNFLETIINSSPNCVYVKDINGRYLIANKTIADLYQTTPEEMIGKKDEDFANQAVLKPKEADFFKDIDLKANLPSGKTAYFHIIGKPIKDKNGKVVSINGTVQDITERKKSEKRLKRFFDLSTDLVCEADMKTGEFTKINPAFKKILGYSEKDLTGKTFYDIVHPEDIKKTKTFIEKRLKHNKKFLSVTVRCKSKNNSYKWIQWNAQVLSKQRLLYGIGRDITEWKKQEQMLKKQMMKYDIEDGNTYLVKEKTLNKSTKAYNDLLDIGYQGLIFSRALKKDFLKNLNPSSKHIWLSDTKIENSIKPKTSTILSKIKTQKEKTVIFFDRLDYIISKNNFERTLDLIQKIREIAILNNLIVIFSIDENLLNSIQLGKLEKETMPIETITKQRLTKDFQQIIEYTHKQNILGLFPKYKDLENEMNISKPTLRNKLRWLVKNNYIIEHKSGRSKNLEVTDKSRNLFI